MKYKELDKINGITILTRAPNNGKKTMYYCLCHCGNLFKASQSDLHSKHTTSCGCIQHYNRGKATLTHGQSDTKLYYVYKTMRNRCYNKQVNSYKNYGGRGIAVCDEWKDDFQAFYKWAMSHGYKEGLQIDRINNDGNYEPNNCRWVTRKRNCNNRRSNINITYNGMTKTATEWAEYLGVNKKAFCSRVRRKWNIDRLFNQPYRSKYESH